MLITKASAPGLDKFSKENKRYFFNQVQFHESPLGGHCLRLIPAGHCKEGESDHPSGP